jgi:Skp family chaperone for outer membrane proteins
MAQFPNFTSIDFSGLDASKLAGLDDKLVAIVRDAAYITIGFGVLTVQQAQVRRRELTKTVAERLDSNKAQMDELIGSLDTRLAKLEAKLDESVAQLEGRLPEQAATMVGQVHTYSKTARKQVRGLVRSAA